MKKTSWIIIADGDENIPGSTQPSLGQNESTMERHVITPFTQPSKQTSDRGTTPQTNSPDNTNSISLESGQEANMENPAMQAMAPEGNGNIIMTGNWKATDYLESLKTASDSEIYFQGFHDGRSGKEMDKSLSNLSDDYFNGWQDGQIYVHDPVSENVSTQPQKKSIGLIDMKPGSNSLPSLSEERVAGASQNRKVTVTCEECEGEGCKSCNNKGKKSIQMSRRDAKDLLEQKSREEHDQTREAHVNDSGLGPNTFGEFSPREQAYLDDITGPTDSRCGWLGRGCGTSEQVAFVNRGKARRGEEDLCPVCDRFLKGQKLHQASFNTECNECGSIRVAHCGTCEGSSEDLKDVTEENKHTIDETVVTASFHCKNCSGSGIVCVDCGCAR